MFNAKTRREPEEIPLFPDDGHRDRSVVCARRDRSVARTRRAWTVQECVCIEDSRLEIADRRHKCVMTKVITVARPAPPRHIRAAPRPSQSRQRTPV